MGLHVARTVNMPHGNLVYIQQICGNVLLQKYIPSVGILIITMPSRWGLSHPGKKDHFCQNRTEIVHCRINMIKIIVRIIWYWFALAFPSMRTSEVKPSQQDVPQSITMPLHTDPRHCIDEVFVPVPFSLSAPHSSACQECVERWLTWPYHIFTHVSRSVPVVFASLNSQMCILLYDACRVYVLQHYYNISLYVVLADSLIMSWQ